MSKKYVEVLSIPFVHTTKKELLDEINERLTRKEKTFLVTANPEIVEYANSHKDYKRIIVSADMIVADGIGIIMASRILGKPLPERITGYELLHDLLQIADLKRHRVYFLGAEGAVISAASERLKKQYPGMNLVGFHHGYIDIHDKKFAQKIAVLEPDIIITALGFPRQEEWVNEHGELFNKGIFIGVGGSFDVIAGKVKGAPEIWRRLNIEWLYRLIQQPARWRRMLSLPIFSCKVLKSRRKWKMKQ